MTGYFAFPKILTLLEPHHQIVLCHIQDTHWVGGLCLTHLQKSSQCILQHQLPGQFQILVHIYIYIYIYINWKLIINHKNGKATINYLSTHILLLTVPWTTIGITVRVFANGSGDWGSIPSWVIPKTQKILFDAALLST